MELVRVLLTIVVLVLSACGGSSGATSTSTGTSTVPDRTDEIARLEADLAMALGDLAIAEDDREELERAVARVQADLSNAQAEARRSAAEAASAVGSMEGLESLLDSLGAELCPANQPAVPAGLADDLMAWLVETESEQGQTPAGTEVIIGSAVTAEGWWLFRADFTARFQPAVVARSPDGDFTITWGGIADSATVIRAWIHGAVPAMPAELALCLDVAGFVDVGE